LKHLAGFIRKSREAIVADWLVQIEQLPSATGQPYGALRDHIPQLLDQIATGLERDAASSDTLDQVAGEHAALRFHAGYDLRQIVLEYQALRQTILKLYERSEPPQSSIMKPVTVMDRSLDEAIGDAVDRFMDERDKARDVFVGILGHDLRNPLHSFAVAAATFLKRRDHLDPALLKAAVTTDKAARRMDRLIGDLLDFARGRLGGGIPIETAAVDLGAAVRAVVEEIAVANPDRSIACSGPDAPGTLDGMWDAARVAQAVSNLIGNAVEHGGDPIAVELVDDGASVRIEVRNRGVVPAEIRPTLFQPFRRGKGEAGLGLGLYVVDEIARAHGGRVDFTSDADAGTCFALVLPRQPGLPTRPRRG
jgi:signal transduction histidine kinase